MNTEREQFSTKLNQFLEELEQEESLIMASRKQQLSQLSDYVVQCINKGQVAALHFICTHNSRRSQLAQIWAATTAAYLRLPEIATYSGGTEVTAFNPRAVAAMERAGFSINHPGGDNPHYQVHYAVDAPPLTCFSKVFDDPLNPQLNFAAVMTCSDADENCPFIPGADLRLRLTYDDPKIGDDTPSEAMLYDERVRQIGRELYYALRLVKLELGDS